jgi:hypothetical protein
MSSAISFGPEGNDARRNQTSLETLKRIEINTGKPLTATLRDGIEQIRARERRQIAGYALLTPQTIRAEILPQTKRDAANKRNLFSFFGSTSWRSIQ